MNFCTIPFCSSGRIVTFSRGCRQSTFAGAVGGNGVGISTSSQSCSTDLCNTGDGLGPSVLFPGFNTNNNNGFGFPSNNGGFNTGFNGGFNSDFHRPGNAAPAGTSCNMTIQFQKLVIYFLIFMIIFLDNPLLLPFLGLLSSFLGLNA